MCKFTRNLHVCGHTQYVPVRLCPHFFHREPNNIPSCGLIKYIIGPPPQRLIVGTTNSSYLTCGMPTCGYSPNSDPFFPAGKVVQVGLPHYSRPTISWHPPPPKCTRRRSNEWEEVPSENAPAGSPEQVQFQGNSRPTSASPSALDSELAGKRSLYEELIGHDYEFSLEDDVQSEGEYVQGAAQISPPRPIYAGRQPINYRRIGDATMSSAEMSNRMTVCMAEMGIRGGSHNADKYDLMDTSP